MKHWFGCGLLVLLLSAMMPARAVIEIEITKGGADAIPIAIVPFGFSGAEAPTEDVASIVTADLYRSGLFAPLPLQELISRPVSGDVPNHLQWRLTGTEFLVVGAVISANAGYRVEFQLYDSIQEELLSSLQFNVRNNQSLRNAAHEIADVIHEEITGIPGAFNTQIAYVSVRGGQQSRQYQLQVADADGMAPQAMLTSPRPIVSPSWAPDGNRIAYVSFENRERSAIFIQDRARGTRKRVISREGINGAPSWSPDGRKLAIVLSHEGNPDIYTVDISSGETRRVTNNSAIDTEPQWLDESTLLFTSNRSGGPQIYRAPVSGGQAERVTFEGNYNTSVSVAPDRRSIAFVHRNGQNFNIATQDLNSGAFNVLTSGNLDESPSFAPNGQMILFASSVGGGSLGAVSIDGAVSQQLTIDVGVVREPSWSPYGR